MISKAFWVAGGDSEAVVGVRLAPGRMPGEPLLPGDVILIDDILDRARRASIERSCFHS